MYLGSFSLFEERNSNEVKDGDVFHFFYFFVEFCIC